MKIFLTAFFFRKELFLWVAGRTRRPIIGSLLKSRENPGHTHSRKSFFSLKQLMQTHCKQKLFANYVIVWRG